TDTPEFMPVPISIAHRLTQRLAAVRRDGTVPYLRPDGKAQVSVGYEGNVPVSVETVVVSAHHAEGVEITALRAQIEQAVIAPVLAQFDLDSTGHESLINP